MAVVTLYKSNIRELTSILFEAISEMIFLYRHSVYSSITVDALIYDCIITFLVA